MMAKKRRAWSLLTKARNGHVSILRDLTLEECRKTYERLDPYYGFTVISYEATEDGWKTGGALLAHEDGDIVLRVAFGPEDWDHTEVESWGEGWPKSKTLKFDDPENPYGRHRKEEANP